LSDDVARVRSYVDRLGSLIESKGAASEPLDLNRGKMQLTRSEWVEVKDIRDSLLKAVQRMFRYSDDLIDSLEVEGAPIDRKLMELSSILNDVIKSNNYGEAVEKLRKTAEMLHSHLEELAKLLRVDEREIR
jgi:hypothetical protein